MNEQFISKKPSKTEQYHENKSHTSSYFPYNTYPCTIPDDFPSVSLHWHDDAEIIYIKKGAGYVSVDLESYPVQGGDIIFIKPGHLHSIYQQNGKRMEYENIIFEMDFLSSRLPEGMYTDFFSPLLRDELDFPVLITPDTCERYSEAHHFLDMADGESDRKNNAYQIAVKGYLFCFFSVIFSGCKKKEASKTNESLDKLKSVLNYVKENYAEEISIGEMADIAGFSESHFMRFFKNAMGKTFTNYLNDYRLEKATDLLTSTTMPILNVASECGYNNLSYFNRSFKEKYGVTPKEYRRG